MLSYAHAKSKPSKEVAYMSKETRVVKDCNGFYRAQIRFLPVEDWEPNEGWRTCFVSSIEENAKKFFGKEATE